MHLPLQRRIARRTGAKNKLVRLALIVTTMMSLIQSGRRVSAWELSRAAVSRKVGRRKAFAGNPERLSSFGVRDRLHRKPIRKSYVRSSSTTTSRLFQSSAHEATKSPQFSFDQEFLDTRRQVDEALPLYRKNLISIGTDAGKLRLQIADLEREQSDPTFWDDSNSARTKYVNTQISKYTRLLSRIQQWAQWEGECQAALEIILQERSSLSADELKQMLSELSDASLSLLQDSKRYELDLLLSGPYDQAPARILLTAGVGGTEANDWVADLKRMYERHASHMGFSCVVEDSQDGEVVGYKSVELLISGPNAYGWLQGEKGAHRLVRLSPFNSNKKRQTTFAGVDVAPDVMNNEEDYLRDIDIPDADLEITAIRAGGKGGQNVNKVSSAVRIKHLPSGLQVKCTQERSQSINKEIALKRLKAQLLAIAQEQRVQEIKEIRGDMVEASWGEQIRNYVLHPYKMVKDQRTGWETANAQAFLDGGDILDDCIGAYLRFKTARDSEAAAKAENQL
jgi:peptide chain release factor 2